MYDVYLKENYNIDSCSISTQNIYVPKRHRDMTVAKIDFDSFSVLVDNSSTVSAFKAVIDYKLNIKEIVEEYKDTMVQRYSDAFIECSLDSLGKVAPYVHFIRSIHELDSVLIDIKNKSH